MASKPRSVELRGVYLTLGRRSVFTNLSCQFPSGSVSVVLGGSGSGKSTLLRLVGGLLRPDAGSVRVGDEEVPDLDEAGLARVRRRLGMLFQSGALLDSLSVFENVALPLREQALRDRARIQESAVAEAVRARLRAVGLDDVDDLLPGELSGGMLRRVALARAIVLDPEIVLCDEPFSGLDPPNVERIESLLVQLNRELGLTFVIASHHPASSLRIADQLVLLRDGVAVSAPPSRVCHEPEHPIATFLGASVSETAPPGARGTAT